VVAAAPAQSRARVSAETASIPWSIWLMTAGISMGLAGGSWDFAWHMSIGRERFWTMPHMMVQSAAILVAIASIYQILTTRDRETTVRVFGIHAPAGSFLGLWGSVAMVASAPFDNWWHNAYGLDVQVVTPPHGLLSLGFFATQLGTMLLLASMIHRREGASRAAMVRLLLTIGSISIVLLTVLIMPATIRMVMHSAVCYLAVALGIPTVMIGVGKGSGHKWGCTIIGAGYTALGLAAEWLLPLVPARPKLGPVYHDVTHLIPLQFPLLLIVPAVVADLLLQRIGKRPVWIQALCVGPAFVFAYFAAQWPFATFLNTPAARNWVFGTAYFSYFDPAGFQYDPYQFRVVEHTTAAFAITLVWAVVASVVTTRVGLGWGAWMRRVRR
jgi:hypothetical protein